MQTVVILNAKSQSGVVIRLGPAGAAVQRAALGLRKMNPSVCQNKLNTMMINNGRRKASQTDAVGSIACERRPVRMITSLGAR